MEIKRYIDLEFENMLASLDRLIRIPSVGGEPEAEAPFGKAAASGIGRSIEYRF